jgi:hypothetical protein
MSNTYAVFSEGAVGIRLGAPGLPVFRITPGRYIAELPPGTALGSIIVQVWVPRSSAWVGTTPVVALAYRIRPSGRTNIWGYSGMLSWALPNWVQVLVVGSYTSGTSPMHVIHVVDPDTTSTRPSARVVAVGYHRGKAIGEAGLHVFVTGSKRLASGIPTPVEACPPTMNALPSARSAGAAQKMLSGLRTYVKIPVAEFHKYASWPNSKASHINTSPVRKSTMCIALVGKLNGADHCPTCEGSLGLVLETVTVIRCVA